MKRSKKGLNAQGRTASPVPIAQTNTLPLIASV